MKRKSYAIKNILRFKITSLTIITFIFLLVAASTSYSEVRFDPQKVYGPRIDKLCMVIIRNSDAQILAAQKGDIDIMGDMALPSDIDRLSRDSRLTMSLARGFHAFFLLLNNKAAPWDDKYVRQAAAQAIDRNNIVRTIYSGYCEPINTWLPPVSPWALPESGKVIFDRKAARAKLKSRGYSWNLAGTLVTPKGKVVPKLKLLTPLARVAPTTAELAEQIADSLHAVGFPVEVEPMDFSAMISKLDRKDYSLAVLAWGMGRNPDSLYSFYHSDMDVEGGYNVTGAKDKELDETLHRLRFAKDKAEAEKASIKAQHLLTDVVPSVPIYSRFSVAAVSRKWKNVLTTDKITADNMWTLMMAEPVDGKMRTLNMVLAEEPRNMNPFVASSAYSWQVLGMIYEGMIGSDPFTLEDMPALAESWSVKTSGSGEATHTELLFKMKQGLKWNDGSSLTAYDIKATIDFLKKNKVPRFFDSVKDVKSVEAFDDGRLIVRMNNISYWHLNNVGSLPCLPKNIIDKIKDWQNWNPLDKTGKSGPYGLIGSGPFMLETYKPGEYVMMNKNVHYRMLSNPKRNTK
ncbi:MAG: ABC transporter substrate-binding protein [Synergistaceae bacterium]|nr:ABC transporter substrate-binding protein [Synergistaceae bacterium]